MIPDSEVIYIGNPWCPTAQCCFEDQQCNTCADPEERAGDLDPPEEMQKYRVSK